MTGCDANIGGKPALRDLSGLRVTVVGLGRFGGGIGAVRWLCSQGAIVTVSDRAGADELADSIAQIGGLDVRFHLGGHDERDFMDAQLLVVSPAVPMDMPLLKAARAAGAAITSEINLFIQRCRAPIVGVTGTVGKSTTVAMAGRILARRYETHVGGNIGGSLLGRLERIGEDHVVVLELSSFQLEYLPLIGISPHVAVLTNLAPNHLDRHKDFAEYASAKKNIFRFQSAGDVLILNGSCPSLADWSGEAPGAVEFFDCSDGPFDLVVPGEHNQANAMAAWAIGRQFGIDRASAEAALADFPGLAHRIEFVAEHGGVRYYNDSKCTTPEGTVVAMKAFAGAVRRAVVIVGGYDKAVSFDWLGAELAGRAKAVVAMGATRDKIAQAVERHRGQKAPVISLADDLDQAVAIAQRLAGAGDVVLLSPACASYDMFKNYEHRGRAFVELIQRNIVKGTGNHNESPDNSNESY